ncbi:MAG: TonB-dependent receptor [Colwellia sp.]|nr:TonB-dependent receptor [Colwellia sp.]
MIKSNLKARKTLAAIAVGTALMLSAPSVMAIDTGMVKGHIISNEGAVLSNATITLKHKTKGLVFTVKTNDKGNYSLRNVPVGEYNITITKDGYNGAEESNVSLRIGQPVIIDSQLLSDSASSEEIERIAITGSSIRRVDLASSTGGITFSQDDLDRMPVDNGFENIAMLAPGTASAGGSNFKGASSFGGSSSAENAYYLNGLNITNIKTGLGSLSIPWEALAQTEVKTGGVSPEFGGALGGIVNAVSKSGDNEFKFGGQVRIDPSSMRSTQDAIYLANGSVSDDGATGQDSYQFTEARFWVSGALIEDELFFYGLYEPRKEDETYSNQTVTTDRVRESDRWFAKADWYVNENHSFGFMAMNNKRTWTKKNYAYDAKANSVGEKLGVDSPGEDGGQLYSVNYNGYLTDNFSVNAVVGRVVEEVNTIPGSADPSVWDATDGWVRLSSHTDSTLKSEEYTRDQARIDFSLDLEEHAISFGVDYTSVAVDYLEFPNGEGDAAAWWTVRVAGDASDSGAPTGDTYIEKRVRKRFTDSDVTSLAFYINDSWQATDNLVLNMGLRYTQSENTMTSGEAYVDFSDQIAPRLQAIYDLSGDGSSKVYATYGRYYQPVSANMNITQGSSATDIRDYYRTDQLDNNGYPLLLADGSPSRGEAYRLNDVTQDRTNLAAGGIASTTLDPMYSDEITIGYQKEVFETMTFGTRVVWRDLGRGVEDSDITSPLNKKLAELGFDDVGGVWFLHNPGQSLTIEQDFDGNPDNGVESVTLSAAEMMLPKMERYYGAWEFTLDGSITDSFRINSSYTYSKNWGNTEGLVKTDNNQADPGWTTSYDYGDVMDHGYGLLPNDHTHVFKLNGSYDITENFIFGFVSSISSGRPQSYLGRHPLNVDSCTEGNVWDACQGYYGHESFYDENEQPAKRGTKGNLDWVTNIDLSLTYITEVLDGDLSFKATVYNVLDSDSTTNINETRTALNGDGNLVKNADYGSITDRQTERYVSFVARYAF